jgi:hypothetical protein
LPGEELTHYGRTVAIHIGNNIAAPRMVGTTHAKIVAVQWFVDDANIIALREAVHQRG